MKDYAKDPVKLRERKMPTGRTSLYLDIYVNGQRNYEYLRLYLVPEKTREDKRKNNETRQLAEAVRAKRLVDVQNGRFGFVEKNKECVLFVDYFNRLKETKKKSNIKIWNACMGYINEYDPRITDKRLSDITDDWLVGFMRFLTKGTYRHCGKKISYNTCVVYSSVLRSIINQALKEELITKNPLKNIKKPQLSPTKREYLTIEELKRLSETPYKYHSPDVRRAFLFSCLTGLRWSDIVALSWEEVNVSKDGTVQIVFRQKKTGGLEYLNITKEAAQLLEIDNRNNNKLVFYRLPCSPNALIVLAKWCKDAGINKHITFHSARHTFATMLLTLDVDLYTVSKLLGHRDIQTTQIYAKIIDKKKINAVNRIPSILSDEK